MAEMIRDGRNRNRNGRNSSGYAAAGRNGAGGCSGLARRAGTHGPVPAGACMQGSRQGRWEPAAHGREQAAWGQHRTGAGRVSVLLPGRTGGRKGGA